MWGRRKGQKKPNKGNHWKGTFLKGEQAGVWVERLEAARAIGEAGGGRSEC